MKYSSDEIKLGLWLRAAVVGAAMLVIGSAQLVSGEIKPVHALALAVAGVIAAVRAASHRATDGRPFQSARRARAGRLPYYG